VGYFRDRCFSAILYKCSRSDGASGQGQNKESYEIILRNAQVPQTLRFGCPEGWQAALYDLGKRQWIDKDGWMHGTLREAKTDLQAKAAALLNKKIPDLDWH
jgi:hypothetical protein